MEGRRLLFPDFPREGSRMILVHTMSRRYQNKVYAHDQRKLSCADFHLVDLNTGKFYPRYLPSMVCPIDPYSSRLLLAGGSLFLIGGREPSAKLAHSLKTFQKENNDSSPYYYFGSTRLNLPFPKSVLNRLDNTIDISIEETLGNLSGKWIEKCKWEETRGAKTEDPWVSNCTTLNGLLYNFGTRLPLDHPYFSPEMEMGACTLIVPEVFDPAQPKLGWHKLGKSTLPPQLVVCKVSELIIPDPDRNRILMRVYDDEKAIAPFLYAYYPHHVDGPKWDCLNPCFRTWSYSAIVAEGVIYFHGAYDLIGNKADDTPLRSELILAYHIEKETWLNVKWSKKPMFLGQAIDEVPVNTGTYIDDFEDVFRGLLLNPRYGTLCFVSFDVRSDANTKLGFFKFKYSLCLKYKTVTLHPGSSYLYEVEGAFRLGDVIPG